MQQHGQFPASLEQGLSQSHLPSLDGLRAMAVFLVVFYHLGVPGINGGTGVLVFFVLSGFLITWLLLKEEERFGRISLKLFYLRRTLRIFPAFYVFWFLLVGSLLLSAKRVVIGQAICSFFYVNNYYQAIFGDPSTWLSHTWSLGVEEQFYLLWPITFLWLKDNRRRLHFLVVSIGAVWLYREILIFVYHVRQGYIYEAFDTRADHLMIGCLLAVALREKVWTRLWRFLVAAPFMLWVTFGCLACSSWADFYFGAHYSGGALYRNAVSFIIDPILTAVFIVQGIAHSSSALGIVLNWRWVRYLGAISYAIYLYHPVVVLKIVTFTGHVPVLSALAGIMGVIAVASASYWFLELPLQGMRARFTPGQPQGTKR